LFFKAVARFKRNGFLVTVGSECSKIIQPLLRHPLFIAFPLFSFCRDANLVLQRRFCNNDKLPRLLVCSRGCGSGGLENTLKNFLRDRPVGKFPDSPADCECWDFSLHFVTLTVRETRDGRGEVFSAREMRGIFDGSIALTTRFRFAIADKGSPQEIERARG
jgi:hypothetical protein